MTTPYQPNASQLQISGHLGLNTEHLVQLQQSFPLPVQRQPLDGNPMPTMCLSHSRMPTIAMSNSQFGGSNASQIIPTDPYCCNFLVQLEGSYETDGAQIQVELVEGGRQYAKVRRQETGGESVVDQVIYEDDSRFTLCLLNGYVLAVMVKGNTMQHSVTWYTNDGNHIVWSRVGDVAFKLVTMTPDQCQRNTLENNFFGVSQTSYSGARQNETVDMSTRIRPELRTRTGIKNSSSRTSGNTLKTNADGFNSTSSESSICQRTSSQTSKLSEDDLFDQFRNYCMSCPSLRHKIIQWGLARTPNYRVGTQEITELAAGRLWVKVTLAQTDKRGIKNRHDILDEVKGAYQEVEHGVFMQPPAQPDEPGVQHRLRKNEFGFWIIEEPNEENDLWYPCIQEQRYGHWVDLNDSRRRCNIQILTMESILYSMRDQWTDLEEMERSMEFLFNSCNQKKLNTKLKARNLKHNISNLRFKLEKQYALSFAVRVAEVADAIALGGKDLNSHAS